MSFKGKMYLVNSGNMKKVGWEFDKTDGKGVLRVEFNGGRTYDYWPVKKALYNELWKAESKGKWFSENIKNNLEISYEEVE